MNATAAIAPRNGARWLTQALEAEGVDTLFGYPGGTIMPFYDALVDSGLKHIPVSYTHLDVYKRQHHDVARLHFIGEDALHRRILTFEYLGIAFEHMDGFIHARGLHHAAIDGQIAVEHGQTTFL